MEKSNDNEKLDVDNIIEVPPFRKVVEKVNEQNKSLPGKMFVKDRDLFIKYIKYSGVTQDLIDGYNNWIDYILPASLAQFTFKVGNNTVHIVVDHFTKAIDASKKPITPLEAMQRNISLTAEVHFHVEIRNGDRVIS